MINLKSLLSEDAAQKISLQQAVDRRLFGPVYHGTDSDKIEKIDREGFKIFVGHERSGDVAQGYETSNYYEGIPAPIHHLGFGVYFTTTKSIAKKFAHGTTTGMRTYFLDVPRLETINFGANRTMMKWWRDNGYDYKITPETTFGGMRTDWGGTKNTLPAIREERVRATVHMTEYLKSHYDAVWFKGKGMYKLLDGDQVCVYDTSKIYVFDKAMVQPGEIGSKVVSRVGIDPYGRGEIKIPMGTKGIIKNKQDAEEIRKNYPLAKWTEDAKHVYTIKWEKGGEMTGVLDKWIEPYFNK